jgi:CelD/BcsL family acetyltransferase involved in cellulose biosynthesis
LSISILNPLEHPDWDGLLATNEQAAFFHTAAWARVLVETYRYTPLYFTLIERGQLFGLLPVMEVDSRLTGRRGVALPFTDICHPLARDAGVFKELIDAVIAHGRRAGWRRLEMHGGQEFLRGEPAAARMLIHTLALKPAPSEVAAAFRDSTRRNIRKAQKNDVTVRLEHTQEAMDTFFRLHCGTRRRHGLPPQPWSFFDRIFKHIVSAGKGFVALGESLGRFAAAAVFFRFRDTLLFKFGASERRNLNHRPNNLVMWEVIRWACQNGIRWLSFGRTDPENSGLLQFKQGWGAVEEEARYYSCDVATGRFLPLKALPPAPSRLFRALPIPLLRLAGSLLYRHVG